MIFGSAFQLHVYPGYEPDEVTPLPEPLQPKDILQTVINAQRDLRKKVKGIKGVIRELKHATFLSHGRQPEVNILQARTLVSPRFSK